MSKRLAALIALSLAIVLLSPDISQAGKGGKGGGGKGRGGGGPSAKGRWSGPSRSDFRGGPKIRTTKDFDHAHKGPRRSSADTWQPGDKFGPRISQQARDKAGRLDANGDGVDDYRNFGERVSEQAHERNAARKQARRQQEALHDDLEDGETPDLEEWRPRNFGEHISRLARDKAGRLDLDGDGIDDFRNFGERVRHEALEWESRFSEDAWGEVESD
jgi:hypothetical protein